MKFRSGSTAYQPAYPERSDQRFAEADGLIVEFDDLHPVLELDLDRGVAIAGRLRELADAQRQDIVPDVGYLSHRVSAWRRLDLRAHRAADMVTNGHNNREWFVREEQDIVRRGRWQVTDYDEALMRFSGTPLPPRVLAGPGLSAGGKVARVGVICACLVPAVLLAITSHAGAIGAAVLPFTIKPLREWLWPLFDDHAASPLDAYPKACPGVAAHRLLVDRLIMAVNEHIATTNPDGVESGTFAETLSAMEILLNQMRRVIPPPVAQAVHSDAVRTTERHLEMSFKWSRGQDVGDSLDEAVASGEQYNQSLAALNARCA